MGIISISLGSFRVISSNTWQPLSSSIVKVYVPAVKSSIKDSVDVNPLGPVHEYENGGKSDQIKRKYMCVYLIYNLAFLCIFLRIFINKK